MKKITLRSIAAAMAVISVILLCGCTSESVGKEKEEPKIEDTEKKEIAAQQNAQPLPDFTVYEMSGEKVTLYESFGRPLVVNFWATWCPPCKGEMPAFEKAYSAYKDKVDFMMINLTDGTRDTVEAVRSFIKENGYTFPVYCDSDMDAAYTYGVQSIPMTLFFSSDGELLNYRLGAISESELEGMLKQMTEGIK